ncbi:hypothetical protein ES703_97971 [subsurface metagenome]
MDSKNYDDFYENDSILYEKLDKILDDYHVYLEKKGHKNSYVNKQINFISFFGARYLIAYNGQNLLEADDNDIYDFLGNWYIRKVLYCRKGDFIPYLRAFKKFFNYLCRSKRISKEQYNIILNECNNPKKYIERFERYMELNPESNTWEDDFEDWMYGIDSRDLKEGLNKSINSFIESEIKLLHKIKNKLFENVSIVEDFNTFGKYFSEQKDGVALTQGLITLKRNDVAELNSLMRSPEVLKKNYFQHDVVLVHFFFVAGKKLGLFKYTKKMKFVATSLFNQFLSLSIQKQYWILFRAFWNKIHWKNLNSPNAGGRPDICYQSRDYYALFFSRLKVNTNIWYRDLIKKFIDKYNINLFNISMYIDGVFFSKILPLFEYFGLIRRTFKKQEDTRDSFEFTVKITELGNQVFSYLSKLGLSKDDIIL